MYACETPRSPVAASPSETAPAARTCAPWLEAVSITATVHRGRPDFFRELDYDLTTGVLRVHDSDPFPDGTEQRPPRVIEASTTLAAESRDRVARALYALCPGAEAMARRCAPGGCVRLTVTERSGKTTSIEDGATVSAVMGALITFFPQVRTR
jgi:hypothetical protein